MVIYTHSALIIGMHPGWGSNNHLESIDLRQLNIHAYVYRANQRRDLILAVASS